MPLGSSSGAPVIKPEHLGTLRTLGQIVEFLASGTSPAPLETPQMAEVERDEIPSIAATDEDA